MKRKNILIFIFLLIFTTNLNSQETNSEQQNAISSKRHTDVIQNTNFTINKLDQLNSKYRETNICITPNGKYLFFMSDRGGQSWSSGATMFKGKKRYDGDIWYSTKENGYWTKAKVLSDKINTFSGEDEPNISPNGQTVYFQSWRTWWAKTGGPYYSAEIDGFNWGNPVGLGSGINDFFKDEYDKYFGYATDGMSISPDGKTFIVACGTDYDGNLDFYISRKKNGAWSYPKRMNLSTGKEERTIFIAADNHTIFFGSAGYGGYGGIDIFKGYLNDDGSVTDIKNIGKPFNSSRDDYGFIITANGEEAYFVREGDIYFAKLEEDNQIAPGASIVISGIYTDCNGKPLNKQLFLQKKNNNDRLNTVSNKNGKFVFSLPAENGLYEILNESMEVLISLKIDAKENFTEYNVKLKDCSIVVPSAGADKRH
ncbi:MAG: hypothetical protein U9Q83_05535 [Bacteroidota bacterium]|nr:hypothetical protein [Bacteroidota bacterium]